MFNRVSFAVNKIAKQGGSHYWLKGINVRPGFTEATNGHQAVRITAPEGKAEDFPLSRSGEKTVDDFPPFIMPTDAAEKVVKAIPTGRPTMPILRNVGVLPPQNGTVRLMVTDLEAEQVFQVTPIDSKFPDLEAVWPKKAPVFRVGLGVEEMELHLAVAKAAGVNVLAFEFYAPESPVKTTGQNHDTGQEFLGAIMPCGLGKSE